MARRLRIGTGAGDPLEFIASEEAQSWEYLSGGDRRTRDIAAAATAAVNHPEDFPPIQQVIIAGDVLAIAADPNTPHVDQVVAGVLQSLPLNQLQAVRVVLGEEATEATTAAVRRAVAAVAASVEVVVHQPENREQLGYLAATESADPIYLNRHLIDADVVIPITVARPPGALDPAMETGGIFPAFADLQSQRRRRVSVLRGERGRSKDAAQAAWLLGLQLVVMVMPTNDGDVHRVMAGTPTGLDRLNAAQLESAWQRGGPRQAELVVACLDGDQQQQTWENVGRALFVARDLVQPSGTIVIVSTLDIPPDAAIGQLRDAQEGREDEVRKRLVKEAGRTALTATLLLDVQREGRVMLFSRLPDEQVELLGLGAISQSQSLSRLIDAHPSCGILRAAQFCGSAASSLAPRS